jgi:hypothetical protein
MVWLDPCSLYIASKISGCLGVSTVPSATNYLQVVGSNPHEDLTDKNYNYVTNVKNVYLQLRESTRTWEN